jgi:acetoin utilization deacetylase AcuC-like enzyme
MPNVTSSTDAARPVDLSEVERTLRASIALMRRMRRQERRTFRPTATPGHHAYHPTVQG